MDNHASDPVLLEKKGAIAQITLNRVDEKNNINPEMANSLGRVIDAITNDPAIKVVLLAGKEGVFSAGAAVGPMRIDLPTEIHRGRIRLAPLIESMDLPVIALINGDAFGQGLELALACDIRICSNRSRFCMPQLAEASIPFDGGTQRLQRTVGFAKTMEMVLLGDVLSAEEALRIRLVSKVVDEKKLSQESLRIAEAIAAKAPIAVRYAREAVKKGMELSIEQGLRLEADLYFILHTTDDRTEGINAFREKRKPRFKGE